MKKLILATTLAFLGLTTTFVACKKESQVTNTENSSQKAKMDCTQINFSEVNIGQLHNDKIKEFYSGVNLSNSSEAEQNILTKFKNFNYDPSVLGFTRTQYNQMSTELLDSLKKYNYDIRNWNIPELRNSSAYPYIVPIMEEIEKFEQVSSLNIALDSIKNLAITKLSCEDRDLVIGTIEITKSSAKLWSDESMGGEGFYRQSFPDKFSDDPNLRNKSAKQIIKAAIIGDASALSASFLKMGAMIAVGLEVPGANVAILVGLAADALLGSAMAALFG